MSVNVDEDVANYAFPDHADASSLAKLGLLVLSARKSSDAILDVVKAEPIRNYVIPVEELLKATRGDMPDLIWPKPYSGVFSHMIKKQLKDIANRSAYFTTNIENQDECFDEFDFPEAKTYIETCRDLGIVPLSYFLRHMKDSHLSMRHHGIGPKSAQAICVPLVLNTSTSVIDLENNRIGAHGITYFTQLLRKNFTIKHFNVAYNDLGDIGTRNFITMLSQNISLENLNLMGNEINDCSATYLAAAIISSDRLKYLNLSHNNIGEHSGAVFQTALSKNEVLESLDLSWNNFREKSAVALIRGLTLNSTLTTIDISYNGLSDGGAAAMARCFTRNTTLLDVNLSCNRISEGGARSLSRGLKKNETLQILRIGKNPLTPSGALLLLTAACYPASGLVEFDITNVGVNQEFVSKLTGMDSDELKNITVIHGPVLEMHLK